MYYFVPTLDDNEGNNVDSHTLRRGRLHSHFQAAEMPLRIIQTLDLLYTAVSLRFPRLENSHDMLLIYAYLRDIAIGLGNSSESEESLDLSHHHKCKLKILRFVPWLFCTDQKQVCIHRQMPCLTTRAKT